MMHHPNMHHQPMSGHPPQHLAGHQAIPAHHQIPPHQMHRENRHVALTRVAMGPSATGGLSAHGQSLGGLSALGVHQHHAPPRPQHAPQHAPHTIRAMPHHPSTQHHTLQPQQMKSMRRAYSVSGGYGPGGNVLPPPFATPHQHQPPPSAQPSHALIATPSAGITAAGSGNSSGREGGEDCASKVAEGDVGDMPAPAAGDAPSSAASGPSAATLAASTTQANSKEKTPMCLVNELARYNKIKHQYRLTSEMGPAHKKVFTVTLRLGDTEEYTAEGSSIKRAQHAAASAALSGTTFPPPPPRAPPAHAPHAAHHRHAGAVMPTVELNALAMKLCQPAVYTSVPPVAAAPRTRTRVPPPYRLPHAPHPPHVPLVPPAYPRIMGPSLIYRVRVCVGGRAWLGEGGTPQAARHDAAARALQDLRPPPQSEPDADNGTSPCTRPARHESRPSSVAGSDTDNGADTSNDILNSEVKSPVSLVHELALKRNQSVQFTVKSERGPPHMRVFVTVCTVGDMETEGEGNGKKVSKRRAAERMLDEMRLRWPPAMLRTRPANDRRRHQPTKKKPRNLIKEGGFGSVNGPAGGGSGTGGTDNPISRLAVARHAARARSPQYRVIEERGAARRREFLVQCDAPPHSATGLGPNKKTAKRRAAHNVLLAMEMSANSADSTVSKPASNDMANTNVNVDAKKTTNNGELKRKESETVVAGGGANGEVRQPVPGVLMMDYHQRSGQPQHKTNGLSETSATGGTGGNTPGAKDQLMYLSQLLGFTVQFSDFPKRNHGEYLSLVSLSTEPPVMCHGGGASTAHSHEQCAIAALRALALMGLEPNDNGMQNIAAGPTSGVISNGITE